MKTETYRTLTHVTFNCDRVVSALIWEFRRYVGKKAWMFIEPDGEFYKILFNGGDWDYELFLEFDSCDCCKRVMERLSAVTGWAMV